MGQKDLINLGVVKKGATITTAVHISGVTKVGKNCGCTQYKIYKDKVEVTIKAPSKIPYQVKGDLYSKLITVNLFKGDQVFPKTFKVSINRK